MDIERLHDLVDPWLQSKIVPIMITILLIILIIIGVKNTYRILHPKLAVASISAENSATVNLPHNTTPSLNVASLHLFGIAADTSIPQSTLDLKLVGLYAAPNDSQSEAIIADATNAQNIYKVGATLPGGATIKQILPNCVIIDYNGHLQRLVLPDDKLKFAPSKSLWDDK